MKIVCVRRAGLTLAGILGLCLSVPVSAEIQAMEGWSRATVPGATVGVGYLAIRNTGVEARKLLRLTSPVSPAVSLHRSTVDAQGMARMWPLAGLQLQPGETVRFEPNGLHLMFTGLEAPFVAGSQVPVTFQFDGGEEPVTVMLTVRPLVDDGKAAAPRHPRH